MPLDCGASPPRRAVSFMFEQAFRNIDDILRKEAGCTTELDYTEQTSWLLFLKYLDGLEHERAAADQLDGKKHSFILDKPYRWESWAAPKDKAASSTTTMRSRATKIIADYATLKSLRWVLARKDDDELIGSCGYTRWLPEQRGAELGYDLAPAYWGFGLMTAAVRAAVAWAFDTALLSRVEALVMTTNGPSIAVLERTGFQKETTLVGYRVARGVPRDFYRYSIASHVR